MFARQFTVSRTISSQLMVAGATLVVLASLLMTIDRSFAVTIIIDDGDVAYASSLPGYTNGENTVNGDYRYGNNIPVNNVATTWTPSAAVGFVSGVEYFVQVDWGVYGVHGNHNFVTTHASGANTSNVNMNQFAAQATSLGTLPAPADTEASGWYTLGRFTLNGSSTVQIKSNSSAYVSSDAVRISSVIGGEGLIIDETSAGTVYSGTWAAAPGGRVKTSASPQSNEYRVSSTPAGGDSVSYLVGSSFYTGPAEVSISWGVNSSYSNNAQYVLDLDGNFGTLGDQTTVLINQQLLTNQVSGGTNVWSGWYKLNGQFNLTANSRVLLTDLDNTRILSADALLVTPVPEPMSLTLVLTGIFGLIAVRRRNR